ncbi:hypothetical protein GA0115261_106806 [Streptomyces sp. OspMP-M43]|nr:hypothetical protein GA0115261_106806 [Streptomyces sp. OspMP-M43]
MPGPRRGVEGTAVRSPGLSAALPLTAAQLSLHPQQPLPALLQAQAGGSRCRMPDHPAITDQEQS